MTRTRWSSFLSIWSMSLLGCPGDPPVDALSGTDTEESTGTIVGTGDGACIPGQSTSCTCMGSDVGVQVCRPDGSGYEPCACGMADDTGTTTESGSESGSETGSETEPTSTGEDPVCGNGVVEDGEACDDEHESARCDDDCTVAACGDGLVNAAALEECDDGGESATCNVDCTASACGDGIFNATAGELCDEGGATALCDGDCTPVECGDGLVSAAAGEACDDAGESATCNSDCSASSCGDGITNLTAGESCDDAGESAACDVDCTLAMCGDSHLNAMAGEACDGAELAGASCASSGFASGVLACTSGCTHDTAGCSLLPGVPLLMLGFSPVKQFDFGWAPVEGADYYQLEQSVAPGQPFVQLGGDIVGTSISHTMPLYLRHEASYRLRACNVAGCTDSPVVDVVSSLAEAVGYVKASNTGENDHFGWSLSLSGDGTTLAIGARWENSGATGIGGDQLSDVVPDSGAVYVFVRDGAGVWTQQAYIKASNTGAGDELGRSLVLSADGDTLAVGAPEEDGGATGVGGVQADESAVDSGAVYVFTRDGMGTWSQQAYVKASNTGAGDMFGESVALSGDGDTLAVGAPNEDGNATGIDGVQTDESAVDSGAVYVFTRDGVGTWTQQAYVKASNTGAGDELGGSLALSGDGNTLAAGAIHEGSSATGIDGDQADESADHSGAVYVLTRDGMGSWSQQAYVKASNTDPDDYFGISVALDGDGNTLAIGSVHEDSSATGIDGDQADDSFSSAGAAYVLVRDGMGAWSQQAYVKASSPEVLDRFGWVVALGEDGNTLVVGAAHEDSDATGIEGDQASNATPGSGAAYVLVRDGMGSWSQQAYIKASNPGPGDLFGFHVVLSGDAQTLAVGAYFEDSNATGIDGDQANNARSHSGAVYLY